MKDSYWENRHSQDLVLIQLNLQGCTLTNSIFTPSSLTLNSLEYLKRMKDSYWVVPNNRVIRGQ